ncbi:hypothetical protein BGZ80_002986 [Entomortierella chlamydospora]|uniref:Uncharacterized protein n=1 Tax=Entomortierella chlamydospora TaxID=101097 RepID=A0A9P6SWX0_9FUNG|nr:hypothetical protein BGZ80_002986 [Entomortierella chlamydospora]
MRTLHSHDSNQHSQGGATPASSEFGGGRSDRYQDLEDGSLIGTTNRQSSAMQHQYSLADSNPSAGHRVKDGEEEDENAEILTSDKKSKNKKTNKLISVEDDEEEGQERGEMRYRDPKQSGEVQEPFSIQMQVDSSSNYVPLRINSVEMSMWMKIDMTNIGNNNGLSSSFTIKPRTIQSISLPMMMDYTSLMIDTNADGIFQDLIAACTPVSSSSGATSLGLNLIFGGKLYISGLSWIWKPQFSFNAENVPCPVNANVTSTSTQTSTSTTGTGAVNTTTSASQTPTASTTVGQSSSQTGTTLSATSTASSTSAARTPTQTG